MFVGDVAGSTIAKGVGAILFGAAVVAIGLLSKVQGEESLTARRAFTVLAGIALTEVGVSRCRPRPPCCVP